MTQFSSINKRKESQDKDSLDRSIIGANQTIINSKLKIAKINNANSSNVNSKKQVRLPSASPTTELSSNDSSQKPGFNKKTSKRGKSANDVSESAKGNELSYSSDMENNFDEFYNKVILKIVQENEGVDSLIQALKSFKLDL
ncbi:predicted protein [Scheffersomyces stipitis CBS 6054]|uniref:Uncharacterized protein n=1 Tax=Scheffersomyces stipitis (strain ATCC 58785 / CBS 6054 / NBRC 10063 / NRRL Y-11545) TaxID=322104 RepID=A3LWB5_PICST|nr:predicted protein [Scheffersomyces stipitis CBS 6054]ABN67253.2 predicted protein [Scheffersomyces stipitis CBS 6054]